MSTGPLLAIAALLGVVLAVFIAAWNLLPGSPGRSLLQQRLADIPEVDLFDVDLVTGVYTRPMRDRLLLPVLGAIGGFVARRSKEGQLEQLRALVAKAGSRQRAETVMALRLVLPVLLAAVGLVVAVMIQSAVAPPANYLVAAGAAVLGYMWPTLWLERKAKTRQREIRMALPGVLDLLTVCMEAGLSLDLAMMRVSEYDQSLLAGEFQQVLNELRLGRPRNEAMTAMADRADVEELSGFVRAMVQAEPLGVSVANVLRAQSEELRRVRKQRAEEAGHRAPVLMLMPMLFCIFPCIFLVLLGPAALMIFGGPH